MRNGSFRAAFCYDCIRGFGCKTRFDEEGSSARKPLNSSIEIRLLGSNRGLSTFALLGLQRQQSELQAHWAPAPAAVLASQAPLPIESTDSVAITNRIGSY